MKRFWTIGFGIMLAALLLAPSGAVHADPPKKKGKVYDKVTAVDASTNTLTIAVGSTADTAGDTKEFTVDKFTAIIVNGKSNSKLSDVQPDMKADYIVKADGKTLSRLEVVDPPVDKKKK